MFSKLVAVVPALMRVGWRSTAGWTELLKNPAHKLCLKSGPSAPVMIALTANDYTKITISHSNRWKQTSWGVEPGVPVVVLIRPRNSTVGCHSANQRLARLISLYLRFPDWAILYFCHGWALYYVSSSRLHHFAKVTLIISFLRRHLRLCVILFISWHVKLSSVCADPFWWEPG